MKNSTIMVWVTIIAMLTVIDLSAYSTFRPINFSWGSSQQLTQKYHQQLTKAEQKGALLIQRIQEKKQQEETNMNVKYRDCTKYNMKRQKNVY